MVLDTTGLVDKSTDMNLTRNSDLTAGTVQITHLPSLLMLGSVDHVIVNRLHSSDRMTRGLFDVMVVYFMLKSCRFSVRSIIFDEAIIDIIYRVNP